MIESGVTRFCSTIREELQKADWTPSGNHIQTSDVRRISVKAFKEIKDCSKEYVFSVCKELLEQDDRPMRVIAFDFAYRMRKHYDEKTFAVFERWLEHYVRGWGDCDDFCTHALGALICQNTPLSEKTAVWTTRDEFWMRRAAAVVLIPAIRQGKQMEVHPLRIADALMQDEHDLVRKGYGWMLKVLSEKEPEMVYDYLLENKAVMPRVSFRYALEKMDPVKRETLMH